MSLASEKYWRSKEWRAEVWARMEAEAFAKQQRVKPIFVEVGGPLDLPVPYADERKIVEAMDEARREGLL